MTNNNTPGAQRSVRFGGIHLKVLSDIVHIILLFGSFVLTLFDKIGKGHLLGKTTHIVVYISPETTVYGSPDIVVILVVFCLVGICKDIVIKGIEYLGEEYFIRRTSEDISAVRTFLTLYKTALTKSQYYLFKIFLGNILSFSYLRRGYGIAFFGIHGDISKRYDTKLDSC